MLEFDRAHFVSTSHATQCATTQCAISFRTHPLRPGFCFYALFSIGGLAGARPSHLPRLSAWDRTAVHERQRWDGQQTPADRWASRRACARRRRPVRELIASIRKVHDVRFGTAPRPSSRPAAAGAAMWRCVDLLGRTAQVEAPAPPPNTFDMAAASALARNYPTLLAKSDPPPRPVGWCFAAGQERGFAAGQERSFAARQLLRAGLSLSTPAVESPAPADSFSCDLSALRALGADDVKPPRTPAAWMILLLSLSHQHTRLRRG